MLINCPECGREVSDMASVCIHCGYPIHAMNRQKQEQRSQPPKPPSDQKPKKSKRMKLPNGFGRITELKGKNLRKPFRAMVSDGKDMYGRPIGRLLKPNAYFETYNEAYRALMQYNENPYNFSDDISVEELYDRWSSMQFEKITPSRVIQLKAAWKYCTMIYKMRVQEVKKRDIKYLLDNATKNDKGVEVKPSAFTKINMKSLLSSMFDYAVDYELAESNPVKNLRNEVSSLNDEVNNPHINFTDDEMAVILKEVGKDRFADMIYVECYTGLRPNELLDIRVNTLNMIDWSIVGGSKTKAGKNRLVPIHERIRPIIQRHYTACITQGIEYLFPNGRKRMSYGIYRGAFVDFIEKHKLNPSHRPHDCRKTFVTMAKKAGVDEYAIKKIVGHAITDVTERVYTVRDIEWLHSELCKMP